MINNHILRAILLVIFCFISGIHAAPGIKFRPVTPARHRYPNEEKRIKNAFFDKTAALLELDEPEFKEEIDIDFENRSVVLKAMVHSVEVWSFYYPELEEYMEDQRLDDLALQWRKHKSTRLQMDQVEKEGGLFEIEIPVKYPRWARRFTGSEAPKLSVHGRRKIIFSGQRTWDPNQEEEVSGFPDLAMDQESDLTVKGTVGRLINVEIKQNTEMDGFGDQMQDQIKIHYKGEGDELEDEIVQEVEAGNTQISLPNTEFSGYSGQHKGLFGIKMRTKVGDLNVTTVASQEKGEGQRKEFRIGEGRKSTKYIDDKDFMRNRYFFLDTNFANFYFNNTKPGYSVTEIKLFVHPPRNSYNPSNADVVKPAIETGGIEIRNFSLLEEGNDYEVDKERGYIMLNESIQNDDILGVYFKTSNTDVFGGDTTNYGLALPNQSDNFIKLKYLKPESIDSSDAQWPLMWKNVYWIESIDESEKENVEIDIGLIVEGETKSDTIFDIDEKPIAEILGIKDEHGELIPSKEDQPIFRFSQGELIFPPVNWEGPGPFTCRDLDTAHAEIYRHYNPGEIKEAKYFIRRTAVSKSDVYNLGFNVIPNSETVRLNGRVLERDKDYVLNPYDGTLTFNTPLASPGAEVQVEYESESIFMAEQKVFLGSRLEYRLPNISDESFIGTSILYKSESIAEQNAQIGREPYWKALLDVNTKLVKHPTWMTHAADALPLVRTKAESHAEFTGEVARSWSNPNTKNGSAVLDDFEGADIGFPFSMAYSSWKQASPPEELEAGTKDTTNAYTVHVVIDTLHAFFTDSAAAYQDTARLYMDPDYADSIVSADSRIQYDTLEEYSTEPTETRGDTVFTDEIIKRYFRVVATDSSRNTVFTPDSADSTIQTLVTKQVKAVLAYDSIVAQTAAYRKFRMKGTCYWYNADINDRTNRVQKDDIWKYYNERRNRNYTSNDEHKVLYMAFSPKVPVDGVNLYDPSGNAWGGVMRAMPKGSRNHTNTEYLEMVLSGNEGVLTIDLGEISEDLALNGRDLNSRENTEDKDGDKTLDEDPDEDLGIDSLADEDEVYYYPNASGTGWDSVTYSSTTSDPAGDNYISYDNNTGANKYTKINGTQGNRKSAYITGPESEDINKNGLELQNNYFRYTINLADTGSEYFVSYTDDKNQWRLYRIPLKDLSAQSVQLVNKPDWQKIKACRMTVSGISGQKEIMTKFAQIELKGNQWEDIYITSGDTASGDTAADSSGAELNVSTVNNEQDVATYTVPPGVKVERDPQTGVNQREQSLQFEYINLKAGQDAYAERRLPEAVSLANYEKIAFYVKSVQQVDSVYFFLRLGTGTGDYYEIRKKLINTDWKKVETDIHLLSLLKDSTDPHLPHEYNPDDPYELRMVGKPQYTSISFLYAGVSVASGLDPSETRSGKVWLDDILVTGAHGESGWAGRVHFDTRFADVFSINGTALYRDGNFVNLSSSDRVGSGNTAVDGKLNATMNVDKFMPARWGVSMPVTYNMSGNLTRPRYRPGEDVELEEDSPEQLARGVINSAAGTDLVAPANTERAEYQSQTGNRSIGVSYAKNTRSENKIVNLTADRTQTAYGYITTDTRSPSLETESRRHSGNLKYDLTPNKTRKLEPFKDTESKHMPGMIQSLWFNPLPTRLDFTIADAQYSNSRSRGSEIKNDLKFDLKHNAAVGYNPFNALSLNYDVGMDRYFNEPELLSMHRHGAGEVQEQVLSFDNQWREGLILNKEKTRRQNLRTNYNPRILTWLDNSVSYDSRFQHGLRTDQSRYFMDVNQNSEIRYNLAFRPQTFLERAEKSLEAVKPVSVSLNFMRMALRKISLNSINGDYSVRTTQFNKNINNNEFNAFSQSKTALLKYQTGVYGRSARQILLEGGADESAFSQLRYWKGEDYSLHREDKRDVNRLISGGTGISIPIGMSLNGKARRTRNISSFADTSRKDETALIFPDVELHSTITGFYKLKAIKKRTRSFTVRTTYRYKEEDRLSNTGPRWIMTRALDPIAGIDATWNNGVKTSIRRSWTHIRDEGDETTITTIIKDTASIAYSIKKEKGIRFLNWHKTFNSNLDIGFGLGHSVENRNSPINSLRTENYNGGPSLIYKFTTKIDGGLDMNYSYTKGALRMPDKVEKSILVRIWAEIRF